MEVNNISKNLTRKKGKTLLKSGKRMTLKDWRKVSFANTSALKQRLVPLKHKAIRILLNRIKVLENFVEDYDNLNIGSDEAEVNSFMFFSLSEEISKDMKEYFLDNPMIPELKQRVRTYIRTKGLTKFDIEDDIQEYAEKILNFLKWIVSLSVREPEYADEVNEYSKHLLKILANVSKMKDDFVKDKVEPEENKGLSDLADLADLFKSARI